MKLLTRMVLTAVVLLTALATTAVAPEPQAEASEPQDCFWTSVFDEENGNLFYPDSGVNYFLGDNGAAGHRAKFTVDFGFLPDGSPADLPDLGYIGANGEDEWLLRAQFQLWI